MKKARTFSITMTVLPKSGEPIIRLDVNGKASKIKISSSIDFSATQVHGADIVRELMWSLRRLALSKVKSLSQEESAALNELFNQYLH